MIPYIGDVSMADAALLRALASRADRILEFGCGASTQIFAAYGRGVVDSVETAPEWIEKTTRNLAQLGIPKAKVTFHENHKFRLDGLYDLIFVDCIDELRQTLALWSWSALAVGGVMCFHDTRRIVPHGVSETSDVQNVCAVIERYSLEIATVAFNQDESNTTVVRKREPLPYVDWMKSEGRTPAQMGLE